MAIAELIKKFPKEISVTSEQLIKYPRDKISKIQRSRNAVEAISLSQELDKILGGATSTRPPGGSDEMQPTKPANE